jgi:acyl carrier protein
MEIVDEVRQVVAKALKVPVADIAPDTRLADIGLNSLDVIEVIYELEEKFGIDIPLDPDEAASSTKGGGDAATNLPFETVAEVANAIKQHVDAKHAS